MARGNTVVIPRDLADALAAAPAAGAAFHALSPSHQREYVQWIADAKKPETRQRRVTQTVERILNASGPSERGGR